MTCEQIEVYLTGYLDGELPQADVQKVEIHLEECSHCQNLLDELHQARDAASNLEVEHPSKKEWKEMESHILENLSRSVGWLILVVWIIMTVAYGLFNYATSPTEPIFEKILVFGLFLGIGLLFLSVLMQRMRESRTDRYKGVLR